MSRKFERVSLYDMVWETPISRLAKSFDLSDNGLRKICKSLAVPTPPKGYWARIAAGNTIKKPQLRPSSGPTIYHSSHTAAARRTMPTADDPEGEWLAKMKRFEQAPENLIVIDGSAPWHAALAPLRKAAAARLKYWEAMRKEHERESKRPVGRSPQLHFGQWEAFVDHGSQIFYRQGRSACNVSAECLDRALRILNAICVSAKSRGYKVARLGEGSDSLLLTYENVDVPVRITERLQPAPGDGLGLLSSMGFGKISAPTGFLRIIVGSQYNDKKFDESPDTPGRRIVNDVLTRVHYAVAKHKLGIRQDAADKVRRDETNRLREIARQETEQERSRLAARAEELSRQTQEEADRREALLAEAERWTRATALRDYADHIEATARKQGLGTSALTDWIENTKRTAAAIDPTASRLIVGSPL